MKTSPKAWIRHLEDLLARLAQGRLFPGTPFPSSSFKMQLKCHLCEDFPISVATVTCFSEFHLNGLHTSSCICITWYLFICLPAPHPHKSFHLRRWEILHFFSLKMHIKTRSHFCDCDSINHISESGVAFDDMSYFYWQYIFSVVDTFF